MAFQVTQIPMTSSELENHFFVTSDKTHYAVSLHLRSFCVFIITTHTHTHIHTHFHLYLFIVDMLVTL